MVAKGQNLMVGYRTVRQYSPLTEELLKESGWAIEALLKNGTAVEVEVYSPVEESKPGDAPTSPWMRDPADLAEMSLDKMNLLIASINKDYGPYETKEEAIAQLSRDLKVS